MKKLLTSIVLALVSVLAFSSLAFANSDHFWRITLSDPADIQNSRTFNLDYVVLSSPITDDFTVDLYQNGAFNQTTELDDADSGRFTVTVPSDGVYEYYIIVTNHNDADGDNTEQSETVKTEVIATIPDSVVYGGKTVSANTIIVNFTVPAGSSIVNVNIYGSTATSFSLDGSTLLASVAATPGTAQSVNVVSSLASSLNIAIVGFDIAGNQSAPTGDSIIRFSGTTATVGSGSEITTTEAAQTNGFTTTSSIVVDGASPLTEVSGATEQGGLAGWKIALITIAAVIVAGAAGWYAYWRWAVNKDDK